MNENVNYCSVNIYKEKLKYKKKVMVDSYTSQNGLDCSKNAGFPGRHWSNGRDSLVPVQPTNEDSHYRNDSGKNKIISIALETKPYTTVKNNNKK